MKYLLPYFGIRILDTIVKILPFRIIRLISSGWAFLLHRIVRYRRQTALTNLTKSFPGRSQKELKNLLPLLYLNLTDVFLETIKASSISPKGIMTHIIPPTSEELDLYHKHFRGAILASAHLANWEWCSYCLPEILHTQGIAVYRPLTNARVDSMMREHRERSRMKIVPMREIVKMLASGKATSHFVLLVADQNPDMEGAHWVEFFGRKTAFFKGPSTLAHRYNLPVFFVYLERKGRHEYQMHLQPLCLDPQSTEVHDITHKYVESLERLIRATPESWLWTHRRWKHTPPAGI